MTENRAGEVVGYGADWWPDGTVLVEPNEDQLRARVSGAGHTS